MKKPLILLGLVLILMAGVASFFKLIPRIKIEALNRTAQIAVDFEDATALANLEGQKISEVLTIFKNSGAQAVVLKEDTLASLEREGQISFYNAAELKNLSRLVYFPRLMALSAGLGEENPSFIFGEPVLLGRIKKFLSLELGENKVAFIHPNILRVLASKYQILDLKRKTNEIELDYDFKQSVTGLGLGLDAQKVILINGLGLEIIPKIIPSQKISSDGIGEKISLLKAADPNASVLLFDDDYVLGFPDKLSATAAAFIDNNYNLALIELADQKGGPGLGRLISQAVIPLHLITRPETRNLKLKTMVARWVRASRERGQRILYLHLLFRKDLNPDLVALNSQYIEMLKNRLQQAGIDVGKKILIPLNLYPVKLNGSFGYNFLVFLNVCFGLSLLLRILKVNISKFLIIAGTLLAFLIFLFLHLPEYESWLDKFLAFLAAIVFSSLAITVPYKIKSSGSAIFDLGAKLFICLGFSLVGGILVAGILAQPNFLLKLDQFAGVKASLILPLFVFLIFVKNNFFSKISYKNGLKKILTRPINGGIFLLIVGAALFSVMYLLRSGNQYRNMVPDWELNLRSFLENLLVARPRFKEIFIGWPALFFVFIFLKKYSQFFWFWLIALLGGLVPISIINSFSHCHTPLLLTAGRVFTGLIIGAAVCFIYFLAVSWIGRSFSDER